MKNNSKTSEHDSRNAASRTLSKTGKARHDVGKQGCTVKLQFCLLFCGALFLLGALVSNAQPKFDWAKSMGGANDDAGQSIATDAAGNIYATGYFSGTADFDPGPETFTLTSPATYSIFISKLDSAGNFVWAKAIGATDQSPDVNQKISIALDAFGNVYTTGPCYQGDFDPGPGTFYLQDDPHFSKSVFILKLNSAGNFVWAKGIGGSGYLYSKSISVTATGDVFLTGIFNCDSGCFLDFDPGPSVYSLGSYSTYFRAYYYNGFLEKLDLFGNFVWVKNIIAGGSYTTNSYSYSMAVDSFGNVYVVGNCWSGISPNFTRSKFCTFIYKMSPAGDLIWGQYSDWAAENTTHVLGNAIALDTMGNVYVAGYGTGYIKFGTDNIYNVDSGYSVFIVKFDRSGHFKWIRGGGSGSSSGDAEVTFLATDKDGNAYLTNALRRSYNDNENYNSYCYKWDSIGNLKWKIQIGGTTPSLVPVAIATNAVGSLFATGWFYDTTDFDPGPDSLPLSSAGGCDVFLLKISQPAQPPLPLTLIRFSVLQYSTSNQFRWQTAQEQNTAFFLIERSTDGVIFHNIGSVAAAGTSNMLKEYFFSDAQPLPGTSFYRLKMTDQDGAFTYSKTIAVSRHDSITMQVFPNPVKNVVQVWSKGEGPAVVQITDGIGRLLKQQKMVLQANSPFIVDVHQLPKGKYYLLLLQNGQKKVKAFLKQ